MFKGKHLLIDCRNVHRESCLDDKAMLSAMARASERAGASVISQVRYHFGHNSPPGFTAIVLLDESHCSVHTYADQGLVALDIFTCGNTDPHQVLKFMQDELDLGEVTIREVDRFYHSAIESSKLETKNNYRFSLRTSFHAKTQVAQRER